VFAAEHDFRKQSCEAVKQAYQVHFLDAVVPVALQVVTNVSEKQIASI
jgi:hypothetical protein